jgi:8-oxo-dGTP pyrophosphatase MutT (NUDIX family)
VNDDLRPLLDLLRAHARRPLDPHEAAMTADAIQFAEARADCLHRACLTGHFTGSAWIVDASRRWTLLVHHRQLGRWLQPGGHADGEPDLRAVAWREAHEETGLVGLRLLGDAVFDFDRHLIPMRGATPAHHHYDLRFAFEADRGEPVVVSDESHEVAWLELDRVAALNPEESIARLVRKTRASARSADPHEDRK